jgi:hypothetical protein
VDRLKACVVDTYVEYLIVVADLDLCCGTVAHILADGTSSFLVAGIICWPSRSPG